MAEIKEAKISDLVFDDKNFNKHTEYGMSLIEKSIRNNGAGRSILIDKNNRIIAGNGVTEIAGQIGLDDVQIVETDGTKIIAVKRTDIDLDSKQGREMALADNATASVDLAWDEEQIQFAEEEFGMVAEEWGVEIDNKEQPTAIEDDFDESTDEVTTQCKKGEVWQLGEHRLMCGDSTSADDVAKLMDGCVADIAFYSPPYNAGFGKNITKDNGRSKYTNGDDDNMTTADYRKFLNDIIANGTSHTQYNFCNIQMLANNKKALVGALYDNLDTLADVIVWDKTRSQPAAAENVLNSQFEFVLVFSNKGNRNIGTRKFHGTLANIVSIPPQKNEYADEHNAVFSVEFASHFVSNFSDKSVLDLFGGTGTTLIACEQLNRKCFMMELDPHYCDVIIARWEKLTGLKAQRLTNGE
jgi:DNA modification methylase